MRLVARFMKPYWALCAVTTVLLLVDVVGALVIPTFAAELLNESATSASFKKMTITAVGMGVAALISGMCAVAGGWCCSQLTSRVGKDMRMALYRKSMDLSIYDFRNFGTASITTRTINDVVNIQMAMTNVLCMLMPVPIIFIIALTLSFRLDVTLSLWLLVAIAFVCVVALFIMRSAAPLFRKLQKLLDRIGAVLLENLTGVRVIRAFNKESHERRRMDGTFVDYADTSIKANRLFANLDGLSYFGMNAFIVVVYFLAGGRISAGNFQIGDITAIVEYAIMALFYLMMAQMVIITLPRALECCERVRLVLDHSPQIADPEPGAAVDMSGRGPLPDGEVLAFRDVTFRFADAQEDTLRHVSFSCKTGQTTAIIGGTGSGKSTIDLAADAPSEILRTTFERAHAPANLRHRMARGGDRGRVPQRVHDVIHHAFACLHAHVLLRRIIQRVHFQFGEQTLEIVLLPVQRLDLQPLQSLGVGFPDALLQSRDALRIRLDDHEHRAAVLIVDSPRQLLDGLA